MGRPENSYTLFFATAAIAAFKKLEVFEYDCAFSPCHDDCSYEKFAQKLSGKPTRRNHNYGSRPMMLPEKWRSEHKLFPYQVGFTCPPFDYDAAPSDFLRMSPDTVGVHGWMLHVPDYKHGLDQRKQNLAPYVKIVAENPGSKG